jgi:alpha-aminoadipate/glutamate carrier protein LysW
MGDDSFEPKSNRERSSKGRIRARCPACGNRVILRDQAEVWDLVTCPECDAQLEIVDLRPPTLDYADSAVDDWDDEEEDWEEAR